MAIVLILVALAMIAGGAAAIVQGVPIMVLERGWTLVIAGAVIAPGRRRPAAPAASRPDGVA